MFSGVDRRVSGEQPRVPRAQRHLFRLSFLAERTGGWAGGVECRRPDALGWVGGRVGHGAWSGWVGRWVGRMVGHEACSGFAGVSRLWSLSGGAPARLHGAQAGYSVFHLQWCTGWQRHATMCPNVTLCCPTFRPLPRPAPRAASLVEGGPERVYTAYTWIELLLAGRAKEGGVRWKLPAPITATVWAQLASALSRFEQCR